jgi:hypothetical protein
LLRLFGVFLDAFMVAGGAILAWMGFAMLSGQAPSSQVSTDTTSGAGTTLMPLIPFAASPGNGQHHFHGIRPPLRGRAMDFDPREHCAADNGIDQR